MRHDRCISVARRAIATRVQLLAVRGCADVPQQPVGDLNLTRQESAMSLLLILVILLVLLGGGGFYAGGPRVGGSLAGLILLVLIILALTGRLLGVRKTPNISTFKQCHDDRRRLFRRRSFQGPVGRAVHARRDVGYSATSDLGQAALDGAHRVRPAPQRAMRWPTTLRASVWSWWELRPMAFREWRAADGCSGSGPGDSRHGCLCRSAVARAVWHPRRYGARPCLPISRSRSCEFSPGACPFCALLPFGGRPTLVSIWTCVLVP